MAYFQFKSKYRAIMKLEDLVKYELIALDKESETHLAMYDSKTVQWRIAFETKVHAVECLDRLFAALETYNNKHDEILALKKRMDKMEDKLQEIYITPGMPGMDKLKINYEEMGRVLDLL